MQEIYFIITVKQLIYKLSNIIFLHVNICYLLLIILCIQFQSALAVAYLNICIPIALGDIVNVVSSLINDNTIDRDPTIFFTELREPAIKLINMYLIQVNILQHCLLCYLYTPHKVTLYLYCGYRFIFS